MKLYGTLTSPYVRRVRAVAFELGAPVELVLTANPEGQAALREKTPIWKVPIAELDGQLIFDSHSILDALLEQRGPGPLRRATGPARIEEDNFIHVVDAALDSAIRLFYIKEANPDEVPYLGKERDRVGSALSWVEARLCGSWCSEQAGFGLAELALYTTLDWMRFRAAYAVEKHPALVRFLEAHASRESLRETAPTLA
jgi:glutathione S-transferase